MFCLISSLPCGLSPCRSGSYCRPRADEYRSAVRGLSRIWFGLTKASLQATLGPFMSVTTHDSWATRSFPPGSSCRHEDRTISSRVTTRVWRVVSGDSRGLGDREPFLLIARPLRIVTATFFGLRSLVASTEGHPGVPAYSQIFFRNYNGVIVTAAVYRGFSLELRLAADPSP